MDRMMDKMEEESCLAVKAILKENLSTFENEVLESWLDNIPYKEIAKKLACSDRCITNSLIRIKRKAIRLKENGSLKHIEGFE